MNQKSVSVEEQWTTEDEKARVKLANHVPGSLVTKEELEKIFKEFLPSHTFNDMIDFIGVLEIRKMGYQEVLRIAREHISDQIRRRNEMQLLRKKMKKWSADIEKIFGEVLSVPEQKVRDLVGRI